MLGAWPGTIVAVSHERGFVEALRPTYCLRLPEERFTHWRDEYLDHFGQLQNNSKFGTEPTFVNSNTQVDLSSSYDVDKNFSVFFEGLNLNSSTFSTHGRFKEQVLDVVDYGPRFTMGVRAKF